jgi:hypothetical protein
VRTFGGARWIGRGGPISWPPRLPDITSLDFFSMEVCEIISVDDIATLLARKIEANPSVDRSHPVVFSNISDLFRHTHTHTHTHIYIYICIYS